MPLLTNEIKERTSFVSIHRKVIGLFVMFWVPVLIFLKLAGEVIEKEPLPFDAPVLLFLHAHASPWLDTFFRIVTDLGGIISVLVMSLILSLYLIGKKRYRDSILLLGGVGGAVIANIVLKFLFHRSRPSLWHHLVTETSFSFPSGHAMASAALGAVICVIFWESRYRWLLVLLSAILTTLIGISRLYLGVHYPSDVLAGWCVSIVWVLLVATVTQHFSGKELFRGRSGS